MGAHINVGRTLNHLERYLEAEEAYLKAKSLLPQPKPGQRYVTRIAPQHLSVFLNLGNLMAKDPERLGEADLLYRQAIAMRNDYVQVSFTAIICHNSPIYLHSIFDILEFEISSLMNWIFFPSLNWIFAGYRGSKNPVQTRKKIQFIKLEISN